MQNKNKILALSCSIALIWANITFADDQEASWAAWFAAFWQTMQNVSTMTKQADAAYKDSMNMADNMDKAKQKMVNKWEMAAQVMQFIKKKDAMSEEEQLAVKEIMDNFRKTITEINPNGKPVKTDSAEFAKIIDANKAFYESLKPYVDETKLEEFNKFVEAKIAQFTSGKIAPNKKNDDKNRSDVKKPEMKKSALSQKTRDLFNKKLDSIPSEKKEEFFKKLLVKIDALLAKTQSEKTKAMILELKAIIQDKLDNLSQNQEEEGVINDILEETPESSSWTTTE